MIDLHDEQIEAFRLAVSQATDRTDVAQAIGNVYHALQDAIDLRRPICNTSGRCCRFDEFGHRLFVTTLEIAAFLHSLPKSTPLPKSPGGCPFQIANLCTVHPLRPFGCRIFFCDATATDWQNQQYERFHTELKRLHQQLAVPYFYVEWRTALGVLGLTNLPTVAPVK